MFRFTLCFAFVVANSVLAQSPRVDREGVPLPDGALARIGSSRLRHPPAVASMLFSADGKTLLSAGFEGIRFWDVATGKLSREFKHPSKWSWPIMQWADDGRELRCITRNERAVLTVLDSRTGKELRQIDLGDWKEFRSTTLSPSGKRLALLRFEDTAVRICDGETGRELLPIPYPPMTALSVTFSPDERLIAISTIGGAIHLHDATDGGLIAELKRDGMSGGSGSFSPDGKSLVVVGRDANRESFVDIWDVTARKVRTRLESETLRALFGAAYSPDGKWIATYGQHNDVSLWDAASGKQIRRLRCIASVLSALFSPDSKTLAVGHGEGYILLWNVATGELLPASPDPPFGIYLLRFSDNGRQLIGTADVVRIWDSASGREVHRYPNVRTEALTVLSPDRKLLAGISSDHGVTISDAATGRLVQTLRGTANATSFSEFAPDSRRIVIFDVEKNSIVWDAIDGKQLATFTGVGGFIGRFAFSPDGSKAASVDRGARNIYLIHLLDMRAYGKLKTFQLSRASTYASKITFSPDGRMLAAVGSKAGRDDDPGEVQIWDVETGSELRSFIGHTAQLNAVAFSPDSRMLATGGRDALRFWEVATGGERLNFQGHTSTLNSIAFAPDGKTVAAASADAPAFVWAVLGRAEQPIAAPTSAELDQAWTTLAGSDAKAAFAVIRRLVAASNRSVAFLSDRLKPATAVDPAKVRELIRLLDSPRFEERQKTSQELELLADRIVPDLCAALASTKSAEVRRAIQRLLDRAEESNSESLRAIRSVEILEHIATPAAREHLRALAAGAPGACLTEAAAAALKRMAK